MKQLILFITLIAVLASCDDDVRNIANITTPPPPTGPVDIEIKPTDINEKGFEFLEKMQGHWVGQNRVIADDFDWFAFDYRANAPSQIHGIMEGGTMGNLFTSFFVTDFKDTRTLMARNGGVLNGIYRTTYFVLDSVSYDDGDFYRFVDAEGSTNTMWMELRFVADSLYFNAYTSRLGIIFPPTRHMTFKAKKEHLELAQAAAQAVGFPQNTPAWDFSDGFIKEHLNAAEGAKSATFLAHDQTGTKDVFTLAGESGDPWTIDQHQHLAVLQIDIERTPEMQDKTMWINLSKDPLTDEYGYFGETFDPFNTVLLFPELTNNESQFLVTYLHPGDYYVNLTVDMNGDGFVGPGDVTHAQKSITIEVEGQQQITIDNINVQN